MHNIELRDYWLLTLESEGLARETLRTYREHTGWLLRDLGDEPLSPFTIRRFLAQYRQGHAPASLRTVVASIRALLRFAVREGLVEESILKGLKLPRTPESEKRVYSKGQLTALFRQLEADRSPLGLRSYALCAVLLDGGLRASEVCNLTLASLRDGALLVGPGKSGRMRMVPLGQRAQRALNRYLATGRPRLRPRCESLFVSRDGQALTRRMLQLTLRRLSDKVGFAVSAHKFRHTFTTVLLQRGADLETVRRLGGWADYTMLRTYVHLADEDLRLAQQRFSPLDGL